MIRVLIADDHAAIRAGLRMMLTAAEDIEVVGEAADGQAALHNALALQPDVVLMDLHMPNVDGIEATQRLAAHDINVLVLTTYDHDDYVFGAVRAGAAGFLLKTAEATEILDAIRRVAAGQGSIAPEISRRIFAAVAETHSTAPSQPKPVSCDELGLTERETDVLTHIGYGRSNKEIAKLLGITIGTTKSHVSHILDKLGLESRTQAALVAREAGLLEQQE